jgi:hypothetical protein
MHGVVVLWWASGILILGECGTVKWLADDLCSHSANDTCIMTRLTAYHSRLKNKGSLMLPPYMSPGVTNSEWSGNGANNNKDSCSDLDLGLGEADNNKPRQTFRIRNFKYLNMLCLQIQHIQHSSPKLHSNWNKNTCTAISSSSHKFLSKCKWKNVTLGEIQWNHRRIRLIMRTIS